MGQILAFLTKKKAPSFEEMLTPYNQLLFGMAYRYTGNKHDAEDLLQELLIDLYRNKEKLVQASNLKSWLMKCLYNKFIDCYRKNKRHQHDDSIDAEIISLAAHLTTHEDMMLHQQILTSLQQLSYAQRAVVCLHDMDGHTLVEISEVLDKPIGTLKSDLHRAREKIKMILKLQPSDLTLRQYQRGE